MLVRTRFSLPRMAVVLLVVQIAAAAGAQALTTAAQRAQFQGAMQRIDRAMAQIDQTARVIDQSQLDPVALVGRLDADPLGIIAFVRNRIAYQPYPGALRGVRGVLMARAGNALDQSLLLAALLHEAGFAARINHVRLADSQLPHLLAEALRPAVPPPPPVNIAALNAVVKAAPAVTDPALEARIRQAMQPPDRTGLPVPVMAVWLENALTNAGVTLDGKASLARLSKWSKDYFWVQYRTDPWAKWLSVQPVFASAKDDFAGLAATQRFANAVPDKWLWQVNLNLTVEAMRSDGLDTISLLDWAQPVASLAGKALSITVLPTNLASRTAFKNLPQTLAQAQLFSARFNGGQTGDLFDLSGNTVDSDVLSGASFGAAGVFMSVGKNAKAAAGALTALGGVTGKPGQKTQPVQVLTGVWIDVTEIPPDGFGPPRHQRRYLLDRIGAAQRNGEKVTRILPMTHQDIARHLSVGYTFVVSGGRPAPGLMIMRQLKRLAMQRPLLAYVSSLRYLQRDDGARLADFLLSSSPVTRPQLGVLRDSVAAGKTHLYRAAPGVVAVETGFDAKLLPTVRMDVLFNPVAGQGIADAPEVNQAVLAGVRMTRLETGRLGASAKDTHRISAYGMLSTAQKSGRSLAVIKPADSDEGWVQRGATLSALDFPQASRDAMLRDLRAGFIIAIPRQIVAKPTHVAWWRVRPATGETLGMMDDGRGSEFTEYLSTEDLAMETLSTVGDIYSTETTLGNVWGCISAPNPSCCLNTVMGNYVIGLGTGSYLKGAGKVLDASMETAMIGAVMSLANVSPSVSGGCG